MESHTNMNPTNKRVLLVVTDDFFFLFGEHTFFNLAFVRVPDIKLHGRRRSHPTRDLLALPTKARILCLDLS
jgi:hypothetical protein